MKSVIYVLLIGLAMIGTPVFGADGDLIVNGKLGV